MSEIKRIYVGFDIETSGSFFGLHKVIAVGMCAIGDDFNIIDSIRFDCYLPDQCLFEQRTWDEFWSKYSKILDGFRYTGKLKQAEKVEKWMVEEFQKFRSKMEQHAKDIGAKYYFVSDNKIFDGGFMNALIGKHTSDMPLPYTASTSQYSSFFETHSMQKGFLLAIDPNFDPDIKSGFTNRIAELYDVPPPLKEHDHNPENDAYSIAYDFAVMMAIREGKIKKKFIDYNTYIFLCIIIVFWVFIAKLFE